MRLAPTVLALVMSLGIATLGHGQRAPAMVLTSPAFSDGGDIPIRYTQASPDAEPGGGTSPALAWTNVPDGTQSFVLHMHDVDVARNRGTETNAHWVVWNIPADARGLDEGLPRAEVLPNGARQISATGPVYRGPGAPASGPRHHYIFELYAIDTVIDVPASEDAFETRRRVLAAIEGHVLGKAVYSGLFRRPE